MSIFADKEPKEKAEEFVAKFKKHSDKIEYEHCDVPNYNAIQCAIIHTQGLMQYCDMNTAMRSVPFPRYWREVLEELEKMLKKTKAHSDT